MIFELLFEKYYSRISTSLMPKYKKNLGKIYINDIKILSTEVANFNNENLTVRVDEMIACFQERFEVSFTHFSLSENSIKPKIKSDVEAEWSGFFKKVSILIDNHDFYKAIEDRFKRHFEGVVKSAEKLAQDIHRIVEIQKKYEEARLLGKSKEKLIQNLHFVSQESTTNIFERYFASIALIRDDVDSYSVQTTQDLKQAKEVLSFQIDKLVAEEKNLQSEHEQFFLGYRLQISRQIDPLCEQLKLFSYRAEKFRSEFIDSLIKLEKEHPEDLATVRPILDQQFRGLLQELEQMQSLEQANNRSRTNIQKLAQSNQFHFFQEAADEAQQVALRAIGDLLREMEPVQQTLAKIQEIETTFHTRFRTLLDTERQYLKLRKETLNAANTVPPFSIAALGLTPENIDELFVPNTSYRLTSETPDQYNQEENKKILDQLRTDGTLLKAGNLGNLKNEPINYSHTISMEEIIENLNSSASTLDIHHAIGIIPVLVDDQDRVDVPHILFFCRQASEARPEITALLEVRQQGKLLYIRKLVCILPLPAQVLNPLLENYKSAYRATNRRINQLIADDFLSNKLKLDFQGHTAQMMTQARQQLKHAYLTDLKQEALDFISSKEIDSNHFLQTVDSLILRALDNIIHGEDDTPVLW